MLIWRDYDLLLAAWKFGRVYVVSKRDGGYWASAGAPGTPPVRYDTQAEAQEHCRRAAVEHAALIEAQTRVG